MINLLENNARAHLNALSYQTVSLDVFFLVCFYKIFLKFLNISLPFKMLSGLICVQSSLLSSLPPKDLLCIMLVVPARVMREGLVTDISVIENRTAVISCPVSGIPQPSIIWFRGELM